MILPMYSLCTAGPSPQKNREEDVKVLGVTFTIGAACIVRGVDCADSWLVRSSPDCAVWVRALAGDIVLCSWARHLTLTVPLSTQVYKWVPANLMLW